MFSHTDVSTPLHTYYTGYNVEDTFLVESSNRHQPTATHTYQTYGRFGLRRLTSNHSNPHYHQGKCPRKYVYVDVDMKPWERTLILLPCGLSLVLLLYIFFFLFIRVVQIQFGSLFSSRFLSHSIRLQYSGITNFLLEQGSRAGWGYFLIPYLLLLLTVCFWTPHLYDMLNGGYYLVTLEYICSV